MRTSSAFLALFLLCSLSVVSCFPAVNQTYNGDFLTGIGTTPHFDINLDLPPLERYAELADYYRETMMQFQDFLIANVSEWTGIPGLGHLAAGLGRTIAWFYPDRDVIDETDAWVDLIGCNRGLLYILQVLYECTAFTRNDVPTENAQGLSTVRMCTSIIVTNEKGETFHARNFDFTYEYIFQFNQSHLFIYIYFFNLKIK